MTRETVTTLEERRQHVELMRSNFAIEDMHADAEDLALQEGYIAGTISLADLLQYARDFAQRKRKNE